MHNLPKWTSARLSQIECHISIGGQYRRYFCGTSTVGTFVVPVPPKTSKVPRYRTGTLAFFIF